MKMDVSWSSETSKSYRNKEDFDLNFHRREPRIRREFGPPITQIW